MIFPHFCHLRQITIVMMRHTHDTLEHKPSSLKASYAIRRAISLMSTADSCWTPAAIEAHEHLCCSAAFHILLLLPTLYDWRIVEVRTTVKQNIDKGKKVPLCMNLKPIRVRYWPPKCFCTVSWIQMLHCRLYLVGYNICLIWLMRESIHPYWIFHLCFWKFQISSLT